MKSTSTSNRDTTHVHDRHDCTGTCAHLAHLAIKASCRLLRELHMDAGDCGNVENVDESTTENADVRGAELRARPLADVHKVETLMCGAAKMHMRITAG